MMTVRAGPKSSVIAGPICQTQYMFIATCRIPACSQPALSTVHHRPSSNTGTSPLAPNRIRTWLLGDSAESMLPPPSDAPDSSTVTIHNVTQVPTTSGANPKVTPRFRSAGPNPQRPGFLRPHV